MRLRFASTQIIRFSSGSLFAILKNTVRVRLRFDKNSVKPVYKTPVWFDSLVRNNKVKTINNSTLINVISYTDKVMRGEIVELHKSHHHTQNYYRNETESNSRPHAKFCLQRNC